MLRSKLMRCKMAKRKTSGAYNDAYNTIQTFSTDHKRMMNNYTDSYAHKIIDAAKAGRQMPALDPVKAAEGIRASDEEFQVFLTQLGQVCTKVYQRVYNSTNEKTRKLNGLVEDFYDVCTQYNDFGATDTEPREAFIQVLEAAKAGQEYPITDLDGWQLFSSMNGYRAAARALDRSARKVYRYIVEKNADVSGFLSSPKIEVAATVEKEAFADTDQWCHNPDCHKQIKGTPHKFRGGAYCSQECIKAHQKIEDESEAKVAAPPALPMPEWAAQWSVEKVMDDLEFDDASREVRQEVHDIVSDDFQKLSKFWGKFSKEVQQAFINGYNKLKNRPERRPSGMPMYSSKMMTRRRGKKAMDIMDFLDKVEPDPRRQDEDPSAFINKPKREDGKEECDVPSELKISLHKEPKILPPRYDMRSYIDDEAKDDVAAEEEGDKEKEASSTSEANLVQKAAAEKISNRTNALLAHLFRVDSYLKKIGSSTSPEIKMLRARLTALKETAEKVL